jgi:hypothetical protein
MKTENEMNCGLESIIRKFSSFGEPRQVQGWFRCFTLGWRGAFAVLAIGCCCTQAVGADDQLKELQRSFDESVRPILDRYCSDCHEGPSAAVGFDFEQFEKIEQILAARKRWRKLQTRVVNREMPPSDCEPLDEKAYGELTAWLREFQQFLECEAPNPGRVTLRRLNRIEYRNTIRDLVGIDYVPANDFPGDDVGYGFDNIADVISLPPILMEKYLNAAEEITKQAIVDSNQWLVDKVWQADEFRTVQGVRRDSGQLLFFTNATIEKSLDIPQAGEYRIIVSASGDQAGDEPVRIAIGTTGGRKVERPIHVSSDDEEEVVATLRLRQGSQRLQFSFVNDYYLPASDGNPQQDRNMLISRVAIQGPLNRQLPETHQKLIGTSPKNDPAEQLIAAEKIIHRFGSRAFRRTLYQDERERLLKLYQAAREDGETFETALRYPLQAVLVSPHFLFKVEKPLEPGQTRELNDFELATSLAYFLWSSMPDDELFRLAASNELSQPTIYRAQVERMLADPKSNALVDNFVVQWLQLSKLERFEPDPEKFPSIDLQMRLDMIRETKLFVGDLFRNQGSLLELLSANHTFVNQRLAELYGIQGVTSDEFQRVSLAEAGRMGLLTQASFLTVTSNPTRTSPVKRGKWIMENLLGEEPPPPDPSAMPIEDQRELQGNLRQRLEQHRADPNCVVCHQTMDQLGFALENFDAVGRWRELDEGLPIDSTGELPTGQTFSNAIEMQRMIRDDLRDSFVRCLTEKLLIYATGRGLEYFDDCTVDKIVNALKENDYRFSELIYLVATSEPFRKRRG